MLSPVVAYIAQSDCINLTEQMGLQLGTKNSRTKITHGTRARLKVGQVDEQHYFDVVDIDRYDVILGTPFFRRHNVELDFKHRRILIDGKAIPLYDEVDEAEMLRQRDKDRRRRVGRQLRTALLAEIEQA